MLIGAYVDNEYNISIRKGDSGSIVIKGIPTDNTYKVSLGLVDPDTKQIIKEFTSQSEGELATINFSVADTESLEAPKKYFYGIKLTLNGEETTVVPHAGKQCDYLNIPFMPTFNVLLKLVEG